jgi:hypothetical protein
MQTAFHGQLQGISVFDVDGTHGLSVGMKQDGFGAQHSVYVEEECLDSG